MREMHALARARLERHVSEALDIDDLHTEPPSKAPKLNLADVRARAATEVCI